MKFRLLRCLFACLFVTASAHAVPTDTSRVHIPGITYHGLDSIIRSAPLTGIFFWCGWCAGCAAEFPKIMESLRDKHNISFYSVNDPETRPTAPRRRFNYSGVLKGYYRIQRYYGLDAFEIVNDHSEQRYFMWYYTRRKNRMELTQTLGFLLFEQSGKLLYASRDNVNVDSIRRVLAPYN